jgi:hypothetical protein
VTITGSFRLVLYGMDATLSANGQGATTLASGEHAKAPGPVDTTPALATADEQYLYAWDAVLTVPLGAHPEIYLGSAQVSALQLILHDAHGRVAGIKVPNVQAHELQLTGTLTADLHSAQATPVSAHIGGQAQRVLADGAPLSLTTTTTAGSAPAWIGAILLLPLATGGLLLNLKHRHRRSSGFVESALDLPCAEAGRVVDLCSRAITLHRRNGMAYLVRACALTWLDHDKEALTDCQHALRFLPPGSERDLAAEKAAELARDLGLPS